ncbi:hypothetical protein DY000_02021946 [Brassica cretica]|uniref:Secreted protein n=1 Tax=Brassica cretica TaxID=69181 RepID=A0ABQ7EFE1_BRACR|nr:hypothetical protein DY000_02021946 [Brassica cretica]
MKCHLAVAGGFSSPSLVFIFASSTPLTPSLIYQDSSKFALGQFLRSGSLQTYLLGGRLHRSGGEAKELRQWAHPVQIFSDLPRCGAEVSAHHPPLFVSRCRRSLLLRSGWTSAVVSVKALAGFASSGGVVRSLSVARVECSGVTARGVVYALASLSGSSSPVFALLSRFCPCLSPVGFGSERTNFPLVLRGGMCGLVGVFCFPPQAKAARAQSGLCLLLGERALASSRLQPKKQGEYHPQMCTTIND